MARCGAETLDVKLTSKEARDCWNQNRGDLEAAPGKFRVARIKARSALWWMNGAILR